RRRRRDHDRRRVQAHRRRRRSRGPPGGAAAAEEADRRDEEVRGVGRARVRRRGHVGSQRVEDEVTAAPKRLTGAEILWEALAAEGVAVVFGYPGGAIMPAYDAMLKYGDRIRHVLVRHEQGAAHMADGYARASGKVGVAIATSGPGATNLVTGIAT